METLSELLEQEAKAFDEQIDERIAGGHIPDLRRVTPCDYFYNNSWRHPDYVDLDFGKKFRLIHQEITTYFNDKSKDIEILEVGCGPGHISLELSRQGMNVTGLDISSRCLEYARQFAESDPWKEERGKLEHIRGDFLSDSLLDKQAFDVVVFVGSLHHFPDQDAVMSQCQRILRKRGLIIALEPTRDRVTRGNAALLHLIKTLLVAGNGFYKEETLIDTREELQKEVERSYNSLKYENDQGEKTQSVNDNEAGYTEMTRALRSHFSPLKEEDVFGIYLELIGGLRFDQKTNSALARYLHNMDKLLIEQGVLQATSFMFVGKKREE